LDPEAEGQDRGHGVGKGQDEEGADEARDVRELGDGGGDDEGEGPVDGHEGGPEELAAPGRQGRGAEQVLQDLNVDDLEADVAVQAGGDEGGEEQDDVAGRLPGVGGEALDDGVVAVLALCGVVSVLVTGGDEMGGTETYLVRVDKDAVKHVADVDEELGAEERLPKVVGVAHLAHKGSKDEAAAVRVDGLVQAVERADEAGAAGGEAVGRGASKGADGPLGELVTERGLHCGVVGLAVGDDSEAVSCVRLLTLMHGLPKGVLTR